MDSTKASQFYNICILGFMCIHSDSFGGCDSSGLQRLVIGIQLEILCWYECMDNALLVLFIWRFYLEILESK